MLRAVGIVPAILIASTAVVPAQGGITHSARHGGSPPQVLAETGTMYDGNNANLRLPTDPNEYWANLWAAPVGTGNIGAARVSAGGFSGAGVQ